MKYKVLHSFADLKDKSKMFPGGKIYATGDIYSKEISKERAEELTTKKNKIGKILLEPIKEEAKKVETKKKR